MKFILLNDWIVNLNQISEIGPDGNDLKFELCDHTEMNSANYKNRIMEALCEFLNSDKTFLNIDDLNAYNREDEYQTKKSEIYEL